MGWTTERVTEVLPTISGKPNVAVGATVDAPSVQSGSAKQPTDGSSPSTTKKGRSAPRELPMPPDPFCLSANVAAAYESFAPVGLRGDPLWAELYDALVDFIWNNHARAMWDRWLSTSAKVVLLENDSIQATVLGTTPLFNPNARIRCLESEIMANAGTPQAGMHMMLLSHEAVDNSTQVATAKVGYARVASAGLQEGIMTPSQRRERLFLDTASQQANAIKKTAEMKERRLTQIMQHRYRCGVLGLDGPTNSESVTYATSAANIDKKRSHDERQQQSREEHLQRHTSIIPALGYSYLSHDMAVKPPHVTKVCQEKIKLHGKHPDTHLRIFNETPPVWHTER
ncbi:hypothetical protein AaE_005067, partial [Aphanomyces astaci]